MSEKVIFLQKILDFVKSSLYLHSRKAIKPIGSVSAQVVKLVDTLL